MEMMQHGTFPELRHTRDRIVAVDVLRVLLGLCVMFYHLASWGNKGGWVTALLAEGLHTLVGSASATFFLLAGYFACRRLSWRKAWDNAFWCLAPFLLWNSLNILTVALWGTLPEGATWYSLYGLDDGLWGLWSLREGFCAPLNGPLWFMRDLTLLFLLSPLLCRGARWLFPLLLGLSLLPSCSALFTQAAYVYTLSPFSVALFTAGCWLRQLSEERQQHLLSFCSPLYVGCFWALVLVLHVTLGLGAGDCLLLQLAAFGALYQAARWAELHSARVRRWALALAPVAFLTFATHHLVWPYLPFQGTDAVLLCPLLWLGVLALLFRGMKRWARPLLHLVAHYKLRADDVLPPQASQAHKAAQQEGQKA